MMWVFLLKNSSTQTRSSRSGPANALRLYLPAAAWLEEEEEEATIGEVPL